MTHREPAGREDTHVQLPPRDFKEIIANYEMLIQSTKEELDFYKDEQCKIKQEVSKIVKENQQCSGCCKALHLENENEKISNEALCNLQNQVRQLTEERDTIHCMWKFAQDTINSLDCDLKHYRDQLSQPNILTEVMKKYNSTTDMLECAVSNLRNELQSRNIINEKMSKCQKQKDERIESLERKLEEKELKISDLKRALGNASTNNSKIDELVKANCELDKSLKAAEVMINDLFCREKEALMKVQEALQVAEHALSRQEAAEEREKCIREDCNRLAATIGSVVEQAASKVEQNMDETKRKYHSQIKRLIDTQYELRLALEEQVKQAASAEARAKTFEKNLHDVIEHNRNLDEDLQIATQAIVEMETKLQSFEDLMTCSNVKINIESQQEIDSFLTSNKILIQRWKGAIEEVTNNLHGELSNLQEENRCLKLENRQYKKELMKYRSMM